MLSNYLHVARMLLDPGVTRVPRAVLGQLANQGRRRLPAGVERSLARRIPGLEGVRFVHRWLDGEMITRHNGQWVINSFLPPFPGPAYERMFNNLLSGRRLSPVSAFLALTSNCPYHCWHCSYKKRASGDLSTSQWLSIIENLHHLGASIIGFTGGEPCTRSDLPQLVAAAAQKGASTILFSSGAGMDESLLRDLKTAGLWSVCLSLDHPDPKKHDDFRGAPGAHSRATSLLKAAVHLDFYTMIGAVGMRELIPALPRLHALGTSLGIHELRIVEPMPCGLLASDPSKVLLTSAEIRALRDFHTQTNRKGIAPKVCAFNQIESPEVFGCGAGTQHLFIDAAGEVCPCDFTAMSFGSALCEPLPEIWTRMNAAMGNPRRHCFVRMNHRLITKNANGRFPLEPAASLRVCSEAGVEPLPDYFQQIMGARTTDSQPSPHNTAGNPSHSPQRQL